MRLMYTKMGEWAKTAKRIPPHDLEYTEKASIITHIRHAAKKIRVREGDDCQVCHIAIKEVLRKHHLVLVAAYPLFEMETNKHIALLCENCHDVAHRLIYGERGGLTWQSVQKLKAAGYWEAFCQLDKEASDALKLLDERYRMNHKQMVLGI